MATVIYNCKACKRGRRVEYPGKLPYGGNYRTDDTGARVLPGIWRVSSQATEFAPKYGFVRQVGKAWIQFDGDTLGICDDCGKAMAYGYLQARHDSGVRCDARCTGARGNSCVCSCDGKNHGAESLFTGLLATPAAVEA